MDCKSLISAEEDEVEIYCGVQSCCVCSNPNFDHDACRVYGIFMCKCGRWWESAWTWVTKKKNRKQPGKLFYQLCSGCKAECTPVKFRQPRAKDPDGTEEKKSHETLICERCKELKKNCSRDV